LSPSKKKASATHDFDRARRILMRRDPKLAAIMKRVGRRPASTAHRDPFVALVRAVVSQQLSSKAADSIERRVHALVDGVEHLSAESLLALDPTALRAAGLSRPKISYLRDLAGHVGDGRLDLHGFHDRTDVEVIEAITAVKGFGVWSAEMFLMFFLERPDIFPVGDLGIVKGMQHLHGMKRRPKPRTMIRLAERWRPYRSVACWYLWRIQD
jgi:DNA-3-methyladenine glycosylase II